MKSALFVLAFVMLAGFAVLGNAPAQVAAPPIAKWEYKVVQGELDEAGLNKLGDEGWELAGTTSNVAGGEGRLGSVEKVTTAIKLMFKRPKR